MLAVGGSSRPRRRSSTSCRANQTSVPSAKTTVTAERPPREVLRSSTPPGMPLSANSTGVVTVRSISVGVSPDAVVSTDTWMVETSGSASIGSVRAAQPPAPRRIASSARTAVR
ncbi:MAG: hypothetical protein QM820_41165 [Minicystis sp.]